eukprot:gene17087-19479_t
MSDKYAKYIEKDPALARRFQSIYVPEPSAEYTAIKSAVHLTGRYLTDKKFPDKAIDLLDESMSQIRNRRERKPAKLLEVEKELNGLLVEKDTKTSTAMVVGRRVPNIAVEECIEFCNKVVAPIDGVVTVAPTSSEHSTQRSAQESEYLIQDRIAELTAQRDSLTAAWSARNASVLALFETRTVLLDCVEKLRAQRRNNIPDVDDFLKRRIEQKENEIDVICEKIIANSVQFASADSAGVPQLTTSKTDHTNAGAAAVAQREARMKLALESAQSLVTETELAGVISQSTGIPVNSMLGDSEKAKLLHMEEELARGLVGQDEAIAVISKCIRLSRAGLRYHDRPLGVFLMIGPTGVGKTELAKSLAEFLFSDPHNSLLRIDMSEYMERFSVSRLIGAPPGYVGYDEGGVLTESIRRRPYQVILLDEFEKAHRDVGNLLLQVFDEGRLSDSQGHAVDYRNTVILLTSNLGSDQLAQLANTPADGDDPEEMQEAL